MDTFVDSSWYFLRYLDPHNDKEPFSAEAVKDMPVDLYIGGMEHAYLHLYFARFFTHFLHSIGKVPCKEPFLNLITQGMVKGRSYRLKSSTKYLKPDEVYEEDGKFFQRGTGAPVVTDWEKMSKSKHNGVDPQTMFDQFGCDTVRLMMLCNVGPASDRTDVTEHHQPNCVTSKLVKHGLGINSIVFRFGHFLPVSYHWSSCVSLEEFPILLIHLIRFEILCTGLQSVGPAFYHTLGNQVQEWFLARHFSNRMKKVGEE